jgi:hypothetical protein
MLPNESRTNAGPPFIPPPCFSLPPALPPSLAFIAETKAETKSGLRVKERGRGSTRNLRKVEWNYKHTCNNVSFKSSSKIFTASSPSFSPSRGR